MFGDILKRLHCSASVLTGVSVIYFTALFNSSGGPIAQLPMHLPADVRETHAEALGLDRCCHVRFLKWARQFFIDEPAHFVEQWTAASDRIRDS